MIQGVLLPMSVALVSPTGYLPMTFLLTRLLFAAFAVFFLVGGRHAGRRGRIGRPHQPIILLKPAGSGSCRLVLDPNRFNLVPGHGRRGSLTGVAEDRMD